jgi:heterodisulfide reductase subunit A
MRSLIKRVHSHERIALYYNTEVIGFEGHVGNFRTRLSYEGDGDPARCWGIEHGVAVVATGGYEYDGDVYLHGQHPGVITQLELERRLMENVDTARELDQVVMIQCVRAPEQEIDYCSRTCCTNTMKNAISIKQINPDCQVYVLYKDLITYGFREQYYTEARERGVIFLRYNDARPPVVLINEAGELEVRMHNIILNQPIFFKPDLVSLSMAIMPAETNAELARILEVPLSAEGFFMENNLKLRPMDFTREGIFLAGLAHYPKFIEETIAQALATAARAMTILSKEHLEVGGTIAVVEPEKCIGCLTCVRTCPFHIPKVNPATVGVGRILGAAYIEPSLCTGCGTCTSECPANAIQLRRYRDDQLVLAEESILGQWVVA